MNVLSKFFNVPVIKKAKADEQLFDVDLDDVENQLPDENLFIRFKTKLILQ